ncbi:MAG TPA: T9SS type A sorting domain-containing protein [Mucilaginibacter sp.]|nr:T9SS type A sorting domain-containing protein [Mucilaginibacter sp.]
MKKQLLKIFILATLLAAFTGNAFATVYDWSNAKGIATGSGTFNYQWKVPENWTVNGAVATNYPGQFDPTDVVQIGVGINIPGVLHIIVPSGSTIFIAALTIGDNSAIDHEKNSFYIEINGTLNVSGTFLQKHSDNLGKSGDGTVTYPLGFDFHIETWVWGIGILTCNKMQIGDNTQPIPDNALNVTRYKFATPDGSPNLGLRVNITTDLVLNSVTRNDPTTTRIISVSNSNASLVSGTITVGGQIILQNTGLVNYDPAQPLLQPQARFTIEVTNNKGVGENKYLYLKGANALSIPGGYSSSGQIGSNIFTFWYVRPNSIATQLVNLGQSFVTYSGDVDQVVYTNASFPQTNGFFSFVGGNYQNLGFSGTGKKTIAPTTTGSLYVSGNVTIAANTPVDLSANNPTIVLNNGTNFTAPVNAHGSSPVLYDQYTLPQISNFSSAAGSSFTNGTATLNFPGTVTNGGTFTSGTGIINLNNSFTNTGTFKTTAGAVNLNQSGNQSLIDNSVAIVGNTVTPQQGGSTFFTLNVINGGTKTLSGSGQFYVVSTGSLNLSGSTILNAGGVLTLNSDVTGSATLPAIPTGSSIIGNATVQRYISANRAYRLISSPVYTGNDGTNNTYRVNYLMNNTYLTGTDGIGGGFSKAGNPTLYLYRENLAPLYTTFLNSNFKGIKNIATSLYLMDDADYPSANLPVGNGVLFYYRGSSKQATLGALTTVGAAATTDTLNAVGVLNQGSVTVHNWYTPGSANLGNTTASGDPNIQGFNLVGNPYASSIDWDKYSTSAGTGITAPNVSPFSYQLIPTGLQGAGTYNVYQAGTFDHKGTTGTDNSNVIASGEGFFVQALDASAQLTFNESAKTNTVVTGANLYMGKPVATNTPSYLRLQLAMDSINTEGIIINFNDNANTAFNIMEDARYKTGTGKVNLASLSSDRVPLSINQLPLSKDQIIALNVGATTDGTYKLNSKAIAGIPQLYDIWLMDAFKKDSVNLRTTATYSFTTAKSDTNTFGSKRFKLVINQNPALAVQLLSFNASKVSNKPQVEVVWKAVNEQNYTHYTVERSTNKGTTFEVVGGLTSSGQGNYSLVDKNAVNGINQYRLKQEDLNSKITYSNVVTIQYSDKSNNQGGNNHLSVYPNPAVNHINLTIDPKNQVAAYSIKITNSVGMIVKQAVTTQPNWQDNVSNLLTGTYLIQVVNNKDNSLVGQTKFVKL